MADEGDGFRAEKIHGNVGQSVREDWQAKPLTPLVDTLTIK